MKKFAKKSNKSKLTITQKDIFDSIRKKMPPTTKTFKSRRAKILKDAAEDRDLRDLC